MSNNPYAPGNGAPQQPDNGSGQTPPPPNLGPGYQGYPGYAPNGDYGQGAYQQNPYPQNPGAFGSYAYGQQFGSPMPPAPLASWGARLAARLIDSLISCIPMSVLVVIGAVVAFQNTHEVTRADGTTDTVGFNGAGVALIVAGFAFTILFDFWNMGFRQGSKGQSLGKKFLHLMVIDENTGQPAGAGAGAGRYFVQFVMGLVSSCVGFLSLIDFLWPLWDDKNQTLHDKIVHTLVVNEPTHSGPR